MARVFSASASSYPWNTNRKWDNSLVDSSQSRLQKGQHATRRPAEEHEISATLIGTGPTCLPRTIEHYNTTSTGPDKENSGNVWRLSSDCSTTAPVCFEQGCSQHNDAPDPAISQGITEILDNLTLHVYWLFA